MAPRAFPYPFKVGTDICHIPRIKSILARRGTTGRHRSRPLHALLSKILTWPERQYFWDRFLSAENAYRDLPKVSQYLAGRFAAKEACRKACTHLGVSNGLHHIIILPISTPETAGGLSTSAPQGLILDKMLEPFARDNDVYHAKDSATPTRFLDLEDVKGQLCEVSISHDTEYAQAVAIVPVFGKPSGQDQV